VSTITFNISGTVVHTISPVTQLPPISHPVVIDGFVDQPGVSANTSSLGDNAVRLITIDGSQIATYPSLGLVLTGGGSAVRGLAITGFDLGIGLSGVGNLVAGNDLTGCGMGVDVVGNDNTIGGTTLGARNIIGVRGRGIDIQGDGNFVQGNYIGVDALGTHGTLNPGGDDGVAII